MIKFSMKRVKPRAKLTTVQLQSARQHSSSSTALLSSVRNIHDNLFCVDCSHILSLSGCVHSFLAVISAQSTSDIDENNVENLFLLSLTMTPRAMCYSQPVNRLSQVGCSVERENLRKKHRWKSFARIYTHLLFISFRLVLIQPDNQSLDTR